MGWGRFGGKVLVGAAAAVVTPAAIVVAVASAAVEVVWAPAARARAGRALHSLRPASSRTRALPIAGRSP